MATRPELNAHEARLLGVLIEKALTTPEQYPLSLNAATAGANQKNNRDPVTEFSEAEVHVGLQGLIAKHLAGRVMPAGSRVEKFRHNARETLELDDAALAVLADLLMRGPQTPGELRGRASRMAPIPTLEALSALLAGLVERGFAQRIDPAPGSRAERYRQLLCADAHPVESAPSAVAREARPGPGLDLEARVAALEREVAALRARDGAR
jgi:uncharacterized protein